MPRLRRSPLRAAGKNDAWFALFFIAAIVIAALIPRHESTPASSRPAPIPASALKE